MTPLATAHRHLAATCRRVIEASRVECVRLAKENEELEARRVDRKPARPARLLRRAVGVE